MLHTNNHSESDGHSYDEVPCKLCFYTVECDIMQYGRNVLPYGATLGFYLQGNCFITLQSTQSLFCIFNLWHILF